MNFYVMTLFPEMIEQAMSASITGRAIQAGYLHLESVNIRDFADNKHNRVDDYPYGGGAGMVMQAEPVFRCYQNVLQRIKNQRTRQSEILEGLRRTPEGQQEKPRVIYLTPQGRVFSQKMAEEYAKDTGKLD